MASSEVEQIVEPLPITEVEGVVQSRYLRAEVEAAVNIVKSTEIQLHHNSQQHSSGLPSEDDNFLESSSDDGIKSSSSSSGLVDGPVLVGTEKMSTPQVEVKESEVENQKEAKTNNKVVAEEGKVPDKENPAQDGTDSESEISVEEEGRPEILDKSAEADGKEAKREEAIAADNGVQNSTQAEAIDNIESPEATTSDDKTDDVTRSSVEAEAVPVENILPEVEMQTKEVSSDLGTKSNDDATDALDTEVSSNHRSMDIVKQEEVHDETQTTNIGEAVNEKVHAESRVEKEAVDAQVQEPLKEAATLQDLHDDDNSSPDANLQISPDAEREGLESVGPTPSPVEEKNEITKEEEEELKTDGIVEQGETVEIPSPEMAEEKTTHDKDEKPSPETSKDKDLITQPKDKNEEAEDTKKETTETVDEPSLGHEATEDHQMESDNVAVESNENSKGLEEFVEKKVEKEASETGKVSEEAQQLAVPVSSEAEESSSGKLYDVITQEKAETPKQDRNEDLVNENKATESFEPFSVEEVILQKDEDIVELSNTKTETAGEVESSIPRETEQKDDAARVSSDEAETITETSQENRQNESKAETKESTEKEISEDKELDFQKNDVEEIIEQSSAETEGFTVSENTKDCVEEIGVENVIPEKEHESEAAQENPEELLVSEREFVTEGDKAAVVQQKKADKESVAEEKAEGGASVGDLKPEAENQIQDIDEAKQATDVTKEVHDEVAKGEIEESNEETRENEELMKPDCIEEMDVKSKDLSTTEAQSSQEHEPAAPGEADHEQNNKQQQSDTVCESENSEEDKLDPEVIVEEEVKENLELVAESQGVEVVAESEAIPESAQLHSQEDNYETKAVIENTEEKARDVEPKELEVDAKEEASTVAVEDKIKEASHSLEVAKARSVKEEKSEAQHQAQPSALSPELLETEPQADTEPQLEVSSEGADESPENAFKEEIPVSDEMVRIQDASDSSLQTISDQALPRSEDTPKQAEGECNLQEMNVEKEIQDEVFLPSAVTDEEAREIPESALKASESKTEEDKVEPPESDRRTEISLPETTTAVKEASEEDKPKQAEESPLNLNVTQQVENDVQEIGNAPAETEEGTNQFAESLATPDTPPSTTMAEEAQQVSREFEVTREEESVEDYESEIQVIPEKEEHESSTITEEMKEEVLEAEGEPLLISKVESEAANVQERENPEDESKQEIVASDDQEASEDPEKETEGESKQEEGVQEVKDEVIFVALADIKEEVSRTPEPAAEVIPKESPEDMPKQEEEEEELLSVNHGEAEIENDNQESENIQKEDAATEVTEETQKVSESLSTSDSPTTIAGETSRQEQDSEKRTEGEYKPEEGQQEKDSSVFEFQDFEVAKEDTGDTDQPLPEQREDIPPVVQQQELEKQVTEHEENKEAEKPLEKTSDITTETANKTSDSALEVITKPKDDVVNETQQEESTAEQVIKDEKIIQVCSPAEESKESQPESEEKAERIYEEEIIQPKENQSKELNLKTKNPDEASQPIEDETTTAILGEPLVEKEMIVNKEINIPSEEHGKIVDGEETKLKTEEQGSQAINEATNTAKTTTVIDKELDTHISQRDQETETVNPAKISLFDMMQQSTRVTQLDLDSVPEDKEEKATKGDETKAEAEKAKSDGEKEEDDENEEEHKNDSGSDGLVFVEAASKETETAVKVVSPKKKSHNILSEVGSKVKHSISKVKKVITGKSSSSNHTKQNSS